MSNELRTRSLWWLLREFSYELHRDLLASQCRKHGVACWATCLMPTPVHLILVPDREEALARALVAAVDDRGRRAQRARLQTRACG